MAQQKPLPASTNALTYLEERRIHQKRKREREENEEADLTSSREPKKSKKDNASAKSKKSALKKLQPRKPTLQLKGPAVSNPNWHPKGSAKGAQVPTASASSLSSTGQGSTRTVTQIVKPVASAARPQKANASSAPAKVSARKAPWSENRKSRVGTSSTKKVNDKNARSAVSKAKVSGASSKKITKGTDTRPALSKKVKGPGIQQRMQDEIKKKRREMAIAKSTPEQPLPTKQEFTSLQQQFEGVPDKATAISLDKQAKRDKRTAAIAKAKAKNEQDALAASAPVDESMVDEPTSGPHTSETNVDPLAVRRAQYYRKNFQGLQTQHKGQCATSVLQCLANLPDVTKLYKDKDSDCVRSEQFLDDRDLFEEHEDIIMEQETGALFRELIAPDSSAIDTSLYDRKLGDTGLFSEEILGDSKVDASQYLTAWIERHDLEHRTLHSIDSTKQTPLGELLNGTLKIEITCKECKETEEDHEDFTSPLQLQVPANAAEVSLEGCIDDYFKAQNVDHECKRCKKLVEATRKTWFSQLPPNIIFSLNRTHDSGAKISTPVRVNLGTINLQGWCGPNLATEATRCYEVSSMITHRGESAQNGKYAAACRIHGSGKDMAQSDGDFQANKWRIVQDETVSKDKNTRTIRNDRGAAQLLFLQQLS
ncbi:MAG: hypothetical protein Q9195_005146 [Heterodermia aff. obscurata]